MVCRTETFILSRKPDCNLQQRNFSTCLDPAEPVRTTVRSISCRSWCSHRQFRWTTKCNWDVCAACDRCTGERVTKLVHNNQLTVSLFLLRRFRCGCRDDEKAQDLRVMVLSAQKVVAYKLQVGRMVHASTTALGSEVHVGRVWGMSRMR